MLTILVTRITISLSIKEKHLKIIDVHKSAILLTMGNLRLCVLALSWYKKTPQIKILAFINHAFIFQRRMINI